MNSEVQRKWVAGGHVDPGLVLLISDCKQQEDKVAPCEQQALCLKRRHASWRPKIR